MSYMTLSSQENHYFRKEFVDDTFSLLCSYFRAHATTLFLKNIGERMHGPSPTSNLLGLSPSPLGLRLWFPVRQRVLARVSIVWRCFCIPV